MEKKHFFMMVAFLMASVYSANSQTVVNSLAELRTVVQQNNQIIEMEPGSYNIEDLANDSRFFPCSGSNNTINLTGVYIDFPVGSSKEAHFQLTGSNNTLIGGEFENTYDSGLDEVTDFVAYNNDRDNLAYGSDPHIQITGSGNTVEGTKMTIRGSFPYGYGSLFGIGGSNVFGLSKRGGIAIQGPNTTIDNCELQMRAFGHGIYIQSAADNTLIKNTLVEGIVRPTNDILAEGNGSLPYQNNYKDNDGNDIEPNEVISLCEDGIRTYPGGGSVIVENCTVKKMRGGIRLYLEPDAFVTNTTAIDCGATNWNMPSEGTVINSYGNFAYAPINDFRLSRSNQDIELTILPSPNAVGSHNIADVLGSGHNIVFHRTPGPYDATTRAIVVTDDNSIITNETEYPIILESTASGNTIYSCGPVTDNGSGNNITQTTCSYDPVVCGEFDAFSTIEAEDYCDMSGIQTETTSDSGGGQNVGWTDDGDWLKFDDVDFGNGAASFDARVASSSTSGTIQLRLGSITGTLIGSVDVSGSTGWQDWTTVSSTVSGATGISDLYVVFSTGGLNINWIEFITDNTGGGNNLALNGTATQSSNYSSSAGLANKAIDGNTSGNWSDGSITHTSANTSNPWWEVDLGDTYNIDDIIIFNRTNCCSDRLSNFTVSVINGNTTTFSQTFSDYPDPSITIDANGMTGDVVRVQINGTGTLSLAEVEVYEEEGSSICATFSTIQAEDFDGQSGIVDEGNNIGYIEDGDWIMYSNVDLTCASSIDVRASSPNSGGDVEVRLGSTSGNLIGTASISSTGNWNSWSTVSANISSVSGTQDVYLVFTGGSGYLFNLDWIEFNSSSSSRLVEASPEQTVLETEVRVYPNPVSTSLTVMTPKSVYNQYAIYSMNGKIVHQKRIVKEVSSIQIDLTKFKNGIYMLMLSGNQSYKTLKLIKE